MKAKPLKTNKNQSLGQVFEYFNTKEISGNRLFFLRDWIINFNLIAANYIKVTNGEAPYLFGEREMNSTLIIALSKFTDACLAEVPTRRKKRGTRYEEGFDGHGRVDFWASYGTQDYFIETKHGYASRNRKKLNINTLRIWNDALKQHALSSKTNNENTSRKIVRNLAFQSVVLKTKNRENNREFDENDWDELANNFKNLENVQNKKSNTLPQYIGLIKINQEIIEQTGECDDTDEYQYHGIVFMATYL